MVRAEGPPGTQAKLRPEALGLEPTYPIRDIDGTVGEQGFVDLRVPLTALGPGSTGIRATLLDAPLGPDEARDWVRSWDLQVSRDFSPFRIAVQESSFWAGDRWIPPLPARAATLFFQVDSGCPAKWTHPIRPLLPKEEKRFVVFFRSEPLRSATVDRGQLELHALSPAELIYTLDLPSMVKDFELIDHGDGSESFGWPFVDNLRVVTGLGIEASVELRVIFTPEAVNEVLLAALESRGVPSWSEPAPPLRGGPKSLLVVHRPGKGIIVRRTNVLHWNQTLSQPLRALPADEFLGGRAIKHAQLIAVVEHTAEPVPGPCGKSFESGPLRADGHVYTSAKVRVMDAGSGRLVNTRSFRGTPPTCDGRVTHWIDFEKIRTYLRRITGANR